MIQGLYPIFNHWHKEGTLWCISDPHFGDKELREAVPTRISDEELISRINAKTGRADKLIILGDVGDVECVKKLRGYKILVCGNHDAGGSNYQRIIETKNFNSDEYTREEALAEMKRLYPNCSYSISEGHDFHYPFHFWVVKADNKLFDEIYTGPVMIGEKVILSHEPLDINWAINFHGHVHGNKPFRYGNHYNFSAEAVDFTPVHLNSLFKNGLGHITTKHRATIDGATKRARKRKDKKK